MKKAKIYITAEEACNGCEKTQYLPELAAVLNIQIPPETKDGQRIIVKDARSKNDNGQITVAPVLVTICIDHQHDKKQKVLIAALFSSIILLFGGCFLLSIMCEQSSDADTTCQRFALKVAEDLYLIEPYFVLGMGFLLAFLFWIVPRPEKPKSLTTYVVSAVVLFLFALSGCISYIKNHFTYIPDINLYHESLYSVQSKLHIAGLQTLNESFDFVAESQMEKGEDPYSYYFKVYQIEPSPQMFVCKNADINVHITWDNSLKAVPVSNEKYSNADIPSIYGDINTDFIFPFNSDTFTLHTHVAGVKMTTEQFGESSLGISPIGNHSLVACLINYDTGEQIDTKTGILGDTITFSGIPDGTYYYTVSCEGYKTAIPESPFKLKRDYDKEIDSLPWSVDLEQEGSLLSTAFKVRVQDVNGEAVSGAEVKVRVWNDDYSSPDRSTLYPLYSDENGYLTSWHGVNDWEFYSLVDFQLYDNCHLEVQFREDEDFVRVEIKGEVGVCVMPDY